MTTPTTLSDFSGVLTAAAPSATAANNVAGKLVTIESNTFLSLGPIALGGTTEQDDPIAVIPAFPYIPKILKNAPKTASEAWTAGESVYLITSTNVYTTSASGNTLAGIAAADAASAATLGDVIPSAPF